jgi:prolipoprotein diacylglyceryltransferase
MSFIGGIVGTILSVTVFFAMYYKDIFQQGSSKFISSVLSLLDAFIPLVPVGIFF